MRFLIVVDMQTDFIDGALGTKEAQSIKAMKMCQINIENWNRKE